MIGVMGDEEVQGALGLDDRVNADWSLGAAVITDTL